MSSTTQMLRALTPAKEGGAGTPRAEGASAQTSVRWEGWPGPPSHPLSPATLSLPNRNPNPSGPPPHTEHRSQGAGARAAKTRLPPRRAAGSTRCLPDQAAADAGAAGAKPLSRRSPPHLHPAPPTGIPRTHFPRPCTHHRACRLQ